ncbi:hypothetical protein MNBD_BACTEROID03-87 [hydrothermal vent metagenome]|uniref:Uncharacterized protein n=1 Tax=hydrothermal vent metagenome TaxID=652676 RepID=A0A3B0SWI1_9ZZZZ
MISPPKPRDYILFLPVRQAGLIRDEAGSGIFILEKYWIDVISKKLPIGKMPNIKIYEKAVEKQ